MRDGWDVSRAAVQFLRRRTNLPLLRLYRAVRPRVLEMQIEVAQLSAWGAVPASARERDAARGAADALRRLRAIGGEFPSLLGDVVPANIEQLTRRADRAADQFVPTTDQHDTRAKDLAVGVARDLLRECGLRATTTLGGDWCRLAAALHYGAPGRHGEMRAAVLKARKKPVV